ncbi:MAG: hypothetical protein PVS3B3_12060 [Ktedonobacteraceae bacterium]
MLDFSGELLVRPERRGYASNQGCSDQQILYNMPKIGVANFGKFAY